MKTVPLEAFLIAYSESDFTNPHEAVLPDDPADCRGNFTHMGAKYWGYESKRHKATTILPDSRSFRYDPNTYGWMQIGLKQRATVKKVMLSTKWFTGNQVRAASIILKDEFTGEEKQVITRTPLSPDAEHSFDITPTLATEVLVRCYHEGGLARVNFFGEVAEQMPARVNLLEDTEITHISNEHYGRPDQAVKGIRKENHMIGWESARTGYGEQALFHLKQPSKISEIVVDTYLHRLNPPLSAHIFALEKPVNKDINILMTQAPKWKAVFDDGTEVIPENFRAWMLEKSFIEGHPPFIVKLHYPAECPWQPVLPFAQLEADRYHRFTPEIAGPFTHILYMHYPNGGIHGLKFF
jgi:allantoicase